MYKVRIDNANTKSITIATMPVGSFGMANNGHVYFRTLDSAFCLTAAGLSFTGNAAACNKTEITLLKPGTKIEIEITE